MRPNPAKTAPFDRLKQPKNVHEVRRLLGMLGYYQTYIKDYCSLMNPVFGLLREVPNNKRSNKLHPVEWKEEHWSAVREAVARLKLSILALPLDTDEFLLETDASDTAVGAILSCRNNNSEWAPVEFASKTLSTTERRWPVRDREAFAIIFGIKKFDHYLRGRAFMVRTDHQSLRWMLEAKEGRVARWASRITEYDITISHKSSAALEHVDYFSRFIDNEEDFDVENRMICSVNFIRASNLNLPSISDVVAAQQESPITASKGFYKKKGVIYYHQSIWVPQPLRHAVISACHSVIPYRHHGIKKTASTIRRVFNWPGLYQDVVIYLSSCLHCQQVRTGSERLQGLFRAHPIAGPFHTIYMDFYKCTFHGVQRLIFTMIDHFTKWAECIPLPASTVPLVTSAFLRHWVCRFGVPSIVMNDNDKTFISSAFSNLHAALGSKNLTITPYHPEGNATIESFHRTLNKGLSALEYSGSPTGVNFDEALQLVLYSYRSTMHLTTGESPAFLVYGMDPRPPADNDWRFTRDGTMQQRLKFLNEMRLEIQWKAYDQRLRAVEAKNRQRSPTVFRMHQLVLVRASAYDKLKYAHATGQHQHKLLPKWSLPYRVIVVYSGAHRALVRSLITDEQRVVHIQNVRFLEPPKSHVQRKEWNLILQKALETMFDAQFRSEKLEKFWVALEYPQALAVESTSLRSAKRHRQ